LDGRERILHAMMALGQQEFFGFLGPPSAVFHLHTLESKAELTRNRYGKIDLGFGEDVRCCVVGHELADEFALGSHQRDEGQRSNAFCFHGGP
jgi:hypothetical protein